jgi:hypothetical protein
LPEIDKIQTLADNFKSELAAIHFSATDIDLGLNDLRSSIAGDKTTAQSALHTSPDA